MHVSMAGRAALVTGASKGIGNAIATAFAGAGADVALVARTADTLEAACKAISEATGRKAVPVVADVSSAEGCNSAFAAASEALGKVDVLVNNAGSSQRGEFESITDDMWHADLELKLFAAIRLTRLAFPGMKERRFGRIINVLNIGAKAPSGGGAPTAVSRAAGMALTKVLANEGAPHNVLVNGLLVGKIMSDQWVRRHADLDTGESLEAYYARLGEELPMGRYGTAEEFANMACFLASEQGSYVTGTAINLDGGLCPVV